MEFLRHYLLSIILFLPAAGAIAVLFISNRRAILWTALGVTLGTFVLSLLLFIAFDWHAGQRYAYADDGGVVQMVLRISWIKAFNIEYLVGIDGLSFPLVLLTTFISPLACIASWKIERSAKTYMAMFLLLQTAILGCFVSLDFFLFVCFFEISMVPVYFIIALWGGSGRQYAAIKFILFSMVSSIALLVVMILVYLDSRGIYPGGSFDLIKLSGHLIGAVDGSTSRTLFILAMIALLIRLAAFPFHTWLGDVHAQSPAALSMIISGLMLNIGGYGILRIALPLFPEAARSLWAIFATVGVVTIVYAALCALGRSDFKRVASYCSISLMGFVLLGAAVMTETSLSGALFMMVAQGLITAAIFFIVGVIEDRARHLEISRLGPLIATMPVCSGLSAVSLFGAMGMPGLCGFVGQIMVLLGAFQAARPGSILYDDAITRGSVHGFLWCLWLLACIACVSIVLTAGYILWTIFRIYLGPQQSDDTAIRDLDPRETTVLIPLTAMTILLGILPATFVFLFTSQTIAALFGLLARNLVNRSRALARLDLLPIIVEEKMPYTAVIDFLNSLIEAEANSIFRFLKEGGPYIDRAPLKLRGPLLNMEIESERDANELASAVKSLGGRPSARNAPPEDQYLTYLTFGFMLPKLIEAKKLMVQRYRNGMGAVAHAPASILAMLHRHIEQHQADADFLGRAQTPYSSEALRRR